MDNLEGVLAVENRTPDWTRSHPSRTFFETVFTDVWKSDFAVDYTSASGSPGTTIQKDRDVAIVDIFMPVFWGHGTFYDYQSDMGVKFAQEMKRELAKNLEGVPTWRKVLDFLWWERSDLLSATTDSDTRYYDYLKVLGRQQRKNEGKTVDADLECLSWTISTRPLQPGQSREDLYDPHEIGKDSPDSRNISLEFYTNLLISEMHKNGRNQPLGVLIAQNCQKHGIPVVLFTDKSPEVMNSEYWLVSQFLKSVGLTNIIYNANTASPDFWQGAYDKVLQERQKAQKVEEIA
jgi:hypothetical protein